MSRFELLIEDYAVTPFVISRLAFVMAERVKKYLPDAPECVFEFANGNVNWYIDMASWDKTARQVVDDLLKDPEQFISFNNALRKDIKDLKKLSREIYYYDLKSYDLSELWRVYSKLVDLFERVYERGMIPTFSDLGSPFLTIGLKSLLRRQRVKGVDQVFVELTTPRETTEIAKEAEELKQLALNHSVKFGSDLIKSHAEKYFWLTFGYEGPAYSTTEVWRRIEKLREVFPIMGHPEDASVNLDIQVNKQTEAIFDIARDWVWLKAARKEAFFACYAAADRIAEELARQLETTKKQIKFLTKAEIRSTVLNHEMLPDLETRAKESIFLYQNGSDVVLVGEEAELFKHENSLSPTTRNKALQKLTGQPAYLGLVSGVVKIIRQPSDIDKMNAGDILVSPATNPNLLPAMQMAAAFVTDVGGITCHAAIMAREMKKPCIVGTKYASQVLKDGDKVEVDADNGVVRILTEPPALFHVDLSDPVSRRGSRRI